VNGAADAMIAARGAGLDVRAGTQACGAAVRDMRVGGGVAAAQVRASSFSRFCKSREHR
jgi:hypothetical protein